MRYFFFATGFLATVFFATGFLAAAFATGAFFAAGAFLAAGAFFAGAFLTAGFFATGISSPPFRSATAEKCEKCVREKYVNNSLRL